MAISRSIPEVHIKEKTGTKGNYSYVAILDLMLTDSKWFRKDKISFKRIDIRLSNQRSRNSYAIVDVYPISEADEDDKKYIEKQKFRIENMVESLPINKHIKSKDECCFNPDLELACVYHKHDIFLGFLLNDDRYKVLDYCFVSDPKLNRYEVDRYGTPQYIRYIEFKVLELDLVLIWSESADMMSVPNIEEFACLECKTCINDKEKMKIDFFEDWIKRESEAEQRRIMARHICKGVV